MEPNQKPTIPYPSWSQPDLLEQLRQMREQVTSAGFEPPFRVICHTNWQALLNELFVVGWKTSRPTVADYPLAKRIQRMRGIVQVEVSKDLPEWAIAFVQETGEGVIWGVHHLQQVVIADWEQIEL